MVSFRHHLHLLEDAASSHADRLAFCVAQQSGSIDAWLPITFKQFHEDVQLSARYWSKTLLANGVVPKSVVGLWLGGMEYSDVVTIYGISRAGYIPQLFSVRLPNPTVIFELLERARARALVYDASFESIITNPPVPIHRVVPVDDLGRYAREKLPAFPDVNCREDILLIFHTSGSTSGRPKLVPCNAGWIDSSIRKAYKIRRPGKTTTQDVSTWLGSMCHIAQSFMLLGSLQHGSCIVKPTKINFSSEELIDMINQCGLNCLNQFATFLSMHLRHARQNPKLLSYLRRLDTIIYSGLPLPQEDEEFARKNNLNLMNIFGSTECAAMLLSRQKSVPMLLSPTNGVDYAFVPAGAATQNDHRNSNNRLLELVVLNSSMDCPHNSLLAPDGHFHTGDLFQEVQPGQYVFRGRDDDWIKSQNSLRCDTHAIEENVRATCADLVDECIVVGSGRSSPALFVEPTVDMDHEKLRLEIIRRIRAFHSRRYLHERITDPELVIIVECKSLPRTATKGNIRRKAVEETYKELLDDIYGED